VQNLVSCNGEYSRRIHKPTHSLYYRPIVADLTLSSAFVGAEDVYTPVTPPSLGYYVSYPMLELAKTWTGDRH